MTTDDTAPTNWEIVSEDTDAPNETVTVTADGHPDDEEYIKHGRGRAPNVSSNGLVNSDLPDGDAKVNVLPSFDSRVDIGVTFESEVGATEIELGGIVALSPTQAEGLAAAIAEAAMQARNGGAEHPSDIQIDE